MNIALAQLNYHIGNLDYNTEKIINTISYCKKHNVELLIFSELALTGYPPKDILTYSYFIEKCNIYIKQIIQHCNNIAVIIGVPTLNNDNVGKRLYNSALFIYNRKINKIINKSLLPDYDVFDEYRYFEPDYNKPVVAYKNKKIGITICEDIWNTNNNKLYNYNPVEEIIKQNPDYIINISASPFNYDQHKERYEIISSNAKKYNITFIYVNQVGGNTDLIFDGGSMIVDKQGNLCEQLNFFEEEIKIVDLNNINPIKTNYPSQIKLINDALILGIKDFFTKNNFKKAVIGLSGGIDSAVTTVLTANAIGNNNLTALLLPSKYSSKSSISDSISLSKNLNIEYHIINIQPIVDIILKTLKPLFKNKKSDITEENIQARVRAIILMAYSNKFGNILLNTSNKSELSVGYGTLYGDMCGSLSVIGDLYKTQIYELAKYINSNKEIIPLNIITKPPSAELKPNQKDTDTLPDYNILDKVLYLFIEKTFGNEEIIKNDFNSDIVDKITNMVKTSEYKRFQSPPILRISTKSFGQGRNIPLVAKY